MQSYTTHRDRSTFPDPESFNPSRWLPENVTGDMNELFMPFSKGTRICIGINLANMELKLITAALLARYKVRVAPSMQAGAMEMRGNFAVYPKGECFLIFHHA